MIVRRVRGSSMAPTLQPGQVVIGFRRRVRVGDVVVVRHGGRDVVKRVAKINDNGVYVTGDNSLESTDSRHYGFLAKSAILGTIMIVLPKAVAPPKPIKTYAAVCGRALAGVVVVLALIHLVRIDQLVQIFDEMLPGGSVFAGLAAGGIVLSEVFSVPFLLRMRLSPAAHITSGALVVLAPLWWMLVLIWTFGLVKTTGLLSGFVDVPSSAVTMITVLVWLALSYSVIYLLGFNTLRLRPLRTKSAK